MTQIKFLNNQEALVQELMEGLQIDKGLIAYKEVSIIEIANFIKKYNLEGKQLETFNGSMTAIFMAKSKEDVDYYMLHVRGHMKEVENAIEKGWI